MEGEEVTTNDLVNVVSGQILSGPEDSIFDDIFDWLVNAIVTIVREVGKAVADAILDISGAIAKGATLIINALEPGVQLIERVVTRIASNVVSVLDAVGRNTSDIIRSIGTTSVNIINAFGPLIRQAQSSIESIVRTIAPAITGSVTAIVSTMGTTLESVIRTIGGTIDSTISTMGRTLESVILTTGTTLESLITSIRTEIAAGTDYITKLLKEDIPAILDTWWSGFLQKILDFGAWVDKLLDAVWGWFTEDIPGSSPRWQGIFETIGKWWEGFYQREIGFWVENPGKLLMATMNVGLGWLTRLFESVVTGFMEIVEGFAAQVGQMNPDIAVDNYKSLAQVGMVAITGLTAMTVAGEFLNPVSHLGLGHISAMVYDMTNYKLITGAAMAALTYAMIRTPLTYHFNDLFRPFILPDRDFMQLMSRKAWTEPEALQNPELTSSVMALTRGDGEAYERKLIGYKGYPDIYHGLFKELANTPLRYFPLAGIARTGFFERVWFTEALHRSGYSQTAIDALMIMYEKMVDEGVQGAMSGAAVKRFKEGLTTEEQFTGEMMLLGYTDKQIPKYMAAAKMDYAYDYIMDLVAAYRDAVRKGNLSMDGYRGALLDLGMVPQRVEGYVLRERARLKPTEALTPIGPPTPVYETDAGKVAVDTTRRQRRKLLITRDQEIAAFVQLGMDPGYATALANNDDVRLAEKGAEE